MDQSTKRFLEDLFREFAPELTAFAQGRLRNRQDAEEVVQDAFFRLQQQLDQNTINNFRAYLYRMVANLTVDRMRAAKRQERLKTSWEQDGAPGDVGPSGADTLTPEHVLQSRQELTALLNAVDTLPPQARKVFLMHKVQQLSYSEIAKRLGLSIKTVERHMARALKDITRDRFLPEADL